MYQNDNIFYAMLITIAKIPWLTLNSSAMLPYALSAFGSTHSVQILSSFLTRSHTSGRLPKRARFGYDDEEMRDP